MSNVQTQAQNTAVQFTTVNPTTMNFSDEYRCARSTAGQAVVGLQWLAKSVSSTKEATNEYQKTLYPTIVKLANEVCDKYMETFTNVTNPLQVQVYGANLNGRFNDGRLKHDITCKNVDKKLRYKYSQLGQLLSLLYDRLLYISRRDVTKIQRYVDNVDERKHYETLQSLCAQFCGYLRGDDNSVMSRWTAFVNSSRQTNNVQPEQRQQTTRGGRGQQFVRSGRGGQFTRGGRGEQRVSRGGRGYQSTRGGRGEQRVTRGGRSQTQ
jgi:hypothetical protein